jgi:hypothetical protein
MRSPLLSSRALWLALCLLAAGCGHMPVMSLAKLARVDFESTDPAQLRAAVKLPLAVKPLPQGVVLRIAVKVGRSPEDMREFMLRELPTPPELASEAGAGTHVFAYRIDEADLPRLLAFRSELIARKGAGSPGGSISIAVHTRGCKTADLADGPVYLTTYLRTAETGDYVALTRDVDLRSLVPGHAIVDEIPRCPA